MLQRERCQSLSLQRCGHLIRQIWIRWTTAFEVCFKSGSTTRGSMMWVERMLEVERTSAERVEAAGQCTPSSWQRLRSAMCLVWNLARRFPWDLAHRHRGSDCAVRCVLFETLQGGFLEYENCYKKRVTGLPNGETSWSYGQYFESVPACDGWRDRWTDRQKHRL